MEGFLTNQDIRRLYESGKAPIRHPDSGEKTTVDQLAMRPAKVDLRIGLIHSPDSPAGERKKYHTLRAGAVAYVETLEDIYLADDMMGLMFPKSGDVAQRGIILTNVGHVDPGYEGKLTYTVINMSSESFELRREDALAYLMLYKLHTKSDPSWSGSRISLGDMADLSVKTDFMDLTQRMAKLAQDVTERRLFQVLTPALILSFLAILFAVGSSVVLLGTPKQHEMELRMGRLEDRLEDAKLQDRVKALEVRAETPKPNTGVRQK